MAIITAGYDGTVDEVQFAKLLHRYSVVGPGDFKASTIAGDRIVSIANGTALGPGTVDVATDIAPIQFEAATGTRWDLVVLRRDWQPPGGLTEVRIIKGGSTNILPAVSTAATGWNRRPGIMDDQPLYLQEINGNLLGNRIDLRCWQTNGGLVANHDRVRSYLDTPGTRVHINGIDWVRRIGANDTAEWVRGVTNFDGVPAGETQIVKTANVSVSTTPNGDAYYHFASPFPNAMVSCVGVDATDPSVWPAMIFKFAAVYSDRTRFCFRIYDHAGNVLANKNGINISFIAVGY